MRRLAGNFRTYVETSSGKRTQQVRVRKRCRNPQGVFRRESQNAHGGGMPGIASRSASNRPGVRRGVETKEFGKDSVKAVSLTTNEQLEQLRIFQPALCAIRQQGEPVVSCVDVGSPHASERYWLKKRDCVCIVRSTHGREVGPLYESRRIQTTRA